MAKKEEIADKSLLYVKEVQEKEGLKVTLDKEPRTYSEGVYYAKLFLAAIAIVSVTTTIGVVQYLSMPLEKYYTTDYKGDVRVLSPDRVAPR